MYIYKIKKINTNEQRIKTKYENEYLYEHDK